MNNFQTASTSSNTTSDLTAIEAILQDYFDGLYHGDVTKLTSIFHTDAWLKSPGVRRSLTQWLSDVTTRATPAELNKPFEFKILSIDVVQDQAMVKIHCPLFDFNYIDFLGLLKEERKWKIVTKMYTDINIDIKEHI
jgi:hypothetical protein